MTVKINVKSLTPLVLAMTSIVISQPILASNQKSIKPKEIRYATADWQGTEVNSGYQVRLEIDSNLSMGIVKNEPFYLCSGTWKLNEIVLPEQDALLAGVDSVQAAKDIPKSVLEKIKLNQVKAQFSLDKQNNFGLICNLGKFSATSETRVSDNMPSISGWKKLIINSVDNRYVNRTLAKDVVYNYVGTLRKDTTSKIAQHKPRIVSVDIDLSAVKIWLAEQAQQKLLTTTSQSLDSQNLQNLAYSDKQGFSDQDFDRFMQSLYEKKRLNEGVNRIEQRFTSNLYSSANSGADSYRNRTCASSESLEQVMGSWFSGTSMFQIIEKCHGVAPDYGFVRTEQCSIQDENLKEETQAETLLTELFDQSSSSFCTRPLMQFVSLKNGRAVSEAAYLQTSGFSKQGLAAVQLSDGEWQVVTNGFNTLKPLPDVVSFRGGFHHDRIVFRSSNGLYGAMDAKFNVVIPPKFEEIQSFSSRITRVKYQGHFGVINKAGHWIVPARFGKAGFVENGHIMVRENEQSSSPWLLINSEGILVKQTEEAGSIPPSVQALLR